jgi:hypothetical protein
LLVPPSFVFFSTIYTKVLQNGDSNIELYKKHSLFLLQQASRKPGSPAFSQKEKLNEQPCSKDEIIPFSYRQEEDDLRG